MNTEAPTAKCNCQHCNGRIAFDPEQFTAQGATAAGSLGPTVTCPHCGMDTIVFLPHSDAGRPTVTVAPPRTNTRRRIGVILASVLGLLLLTSFIALLARNESVQQTTALAGGSVIAMVLFGILFLIALLWLLFPVFMYFGMNRLEKLLEQIERNTRTP